MYSTQISAQHNINKPHRCSGSTVPFLHRWKKKSCHGVIAILKLWTMELSLTQDPDVIIHPEHGPLLVPTINYFGGREGESYV